MNDGSNYDRISSNQEIAAVVAAYRQSGRTLKVFAREQGIRPGRLHYWIYQKGQEPESNRLAKEPRVGPRVAFQEVKLEAQAALLPSWEAEVSLARGLKVRFSGTARPDWVGAVVQALQKSC